METLRQDKRKFLFSVQNGVSPVYEEEPYTDAQGNVYYLETGDTEIVYTEPQEFFASMNEAGGEAEAVEFGLSVTDYEAVMVFKKNDYEIPEGSIIWVESPVKYKNGGNMVDVEIDGNTVTQKVPDESSADYRVVKAPKSLNVQKLVLKAISK